MRQQPGPSAFLTVGTALRVQLHAVRSGAPAPAGASQPRAQVWSRRCGDGPAEGVPAEGGGAGPPWPALQACSLQASVEMLNAVLKNIFDAHILTPTTDTALVQTPHIKKPVSC